MSFVTGATSATAVSSTVGSNWFTATDTISYHKSATTLTEALTSGDVNSRGPTYDDSSQLPVSDNRVDLAAVVWLSTATVISVAGNAAIVWVVLATPGLRITPHNRLVVQLAVCDMLTAVVNGPPTIAALLLGRWTFGNVACQFNGMSTTLFGIASVMTLAVISLNRCYMVAYTMKGFKIFTAKRTNSFIAAIWLFSILYSVPPIMGWSKYEFISTKAICTIRWSTSPSYTVYVLGLGVFIPFLVMIGAYFRIFRKVRETNRRVATSLVVPPIGTDGRRVANSNGPDSFAEFTFVAQLLQQQLAGLDATPASMYESTASVTSGPHTVSTIPSGAGRQWIARRLSLASSSTNGIGSGGINHGRPSDQTTTTCSSGGGQTALIWTSNVAVESNQAMVVRRSLSNIKDCSTAGSESTTVNEPNSSAVGRRPPGTTSSSQQNVTSSETTSSDATVIFTPIRVFSRRLGRQTSKLSIRSRDGAPAPAPPPPVRLLSNEGSSVMAPAINLASSTKSEAADVAPMVDNQNGSFDDKPVMIAPKPEVATVTEICGGIRRRCSSVVDIPVRLTTKVESAVENQPAPVASGLNGVVAGGASALLTRESRISANCSSGRISLQPSSMTTWTGSSPRHAATMACQLNGEHSIVRRPSSLSATAVADAERRSFELRRQIERSRRTRLGDELKVSLALLVVIVVFIVSWAPISLVNCLETLGFGHLVYVWVDHAAVCMMFLQSAINPVVYGAMNRNFRDGFERCCNRTKKPTKAGVP